jgi:hypothetical protein
MLIYRFWIALGLLFGFACSLQAKMIPYRLTCDLGKGATQTLRTQSISVRLLRRDGTCHVEVADLQGTVLFEHVATGMQVSSVLGPTDESLRLFVVQVDSSPNQLFAFALGSHPRVLATIKNGYGFWVENGCGDGRSHIWTADDAFQGDPELADVYHQDLFVPEVVLDVHGNKLIDGTAACKRYFDRRIAAVRASMTAQEIAAFKNRALKDAFRSGQVKGYILYIAFADLYTGQEQAAHDVLRRMWPPEDEERVWNWMLRKRSEGILTRLKDTSAM